MLEPYENLEAFGYKSKSGKGTIVNKHEGLDFVVSTVKTINSFNVKRNFAFIGSLDLIFRLSYSFDRKVGLVEAREYEEAIKAVGKEYRGMKRQRELHRQFLSLVLLEEIDSLYFIGYETSGRPVFTNKKEIKKEYP